MSSPARNLAILLFDNVEDLELCGPFEVFSVASRKTSSPAFNVFTVAESDQPLTTSNGLTVIPDHKLSDCPKPSILVVPGGIGSRPLLKNAELINWIKQIASEAELVLSVCTGALLLGKAGLLEGLEATTHQVGFELLREIVPTATLREDRRFVDNGKIITSAGIAAGIDMSLHVVARLLGDSVALATSIHMEYPWQPQRDLHDLLDIRQEDPSAPSAVGLIKQLSAELAQQYDHSDDGSGDFRPEEAIPRSVFLVGRLGDEPVACGAIRPLEDDVAEVKRMFVKPDQRGKGFSKQILTELERAAVRLGYRVLRLETGNRQQQAISLYAKAGYYCIPPFGIYVNSRRSICFEKQLS